MILSYRYQKKHACIVANWSDEDGSSCIYRDVIQKLSDAHGDAFDRYVSIAIEADSMADKLYKLIHEYTNEYYALPYDFKNRKLFLHAFSGICDVLGNSIRAERSPEEKIVALLFFSVLDNFYDLTALFLRDNAYQKKHQERRETKEEWLETTPERLVSCQFENKLLHRVEMDRVLGLLSDKEHRRFVRRLFCGLTFREIADSEGVAKSIVRKSVLTALKKIRENFER